ncbi:hypothetical protein ACFVX6_31335 [Streptomyces sp. NPDC058289]|uniref:hypothetical protein n=1 Tax=Streptomyces sp. NPDC058289 TaxID=3346425 RepID=UPI0036EC834A
MDAIWTAVVAAGSAVVASATTGWFTTVAARTQARLNREMQASQLLEGPPAAGVAVRELYEAVNAFWSAARRLNDAVHSGDPARIAEHRALTDQRRREARSNRDAFVESAREALNPSANTAV